MFNQKATRLKGEETVDSISLENTETLELREEQKNKKTCSALLEFVLFSCLFDLCPPGLDVYA